MAKFIELHEGSGRIYINIESIDNVVEMDNGNAVIVTKADRIYPKEDYDKVTNMVFDLMN